LIECEGLHKSYDPGVPVLSDVTFMIQPGEFVVLAGESGQGKSTLLKLLYAEEKPTAVFQLHVNGFNLQRLRPGDIPRLRRTLGLVFQDLKLFLSRTVYENVAYPLHVLGASASSIAEEVHNVLSVLQMEAKMAVRIHELSSAEKVRVAIARAIVHHPQALLADEPFLALDDRAALELMQFLERVNAMGTTVFLATRDVKPIHQAGKKVLYLEQGRVTGRTSNGSGPTPRPADPAI